MNLSQNLLKAYVLFYPLLFMFSLMFQQFPPYLENPPSPLSDEDRKRYDLQLGCVQRILAVFDQVGYDDKNAESQRQIADLMAEVCCVSC
jgi:peroxin-19